MSWVRAGFFRANVRVGGFRKTPVFTSSLVFWHRDLLGDTTVHTLRSSYFLFVCELHSEDKGLSSCSCSCSLYTSHHAHATCA